MNPPYTSRLPFFTLINIEGGDAAAFLHSQLSNHIQALDNGEACFATYNNPKGRVIANMLVIRHHHGFWLLTAADLAETLVKRLKMFVMRSKVDIGINTTLKIFGQTNTINPHHSPAIPLKFSYTETDGVIRIPLNNGNSLIIADNNDRDGHSENTWFATEIRTGRPWISLATSESCVAQMLNQHRLGAVHFKKGCYPGQEIIARAQYRGQVKRGLVLTRSSSPIPPGTTVCNDNGSEAGIVINQAEDSNGFLQLAVIKHQALDGTIYAADIPLAVVQNWFDITENAN